MFFDKIEARLRNKDRLKIVWICTKSKKQAAGLIWKALLDMPMLVQKQSEELLINWTSCFREK